MIDLHNMTADELTAEMKDCLEELDYWRIDLRYGDSDESYKASRFIKSAETRLEAVKGELRRRREARQ